MGTSGRARGTGADTASDVKGYLCLALRTEEFDVNKRRWLFISWRQAYEAPINVSQTP